MNESMIAQKTKQVLALKAGMGKCSNLRHANISKEILKQSKENLSDWKRIGNIKYTKQREGRLSWERWKVVPVWGDRKTA